MKQSATAVVVACTAAALLWHSSAAAQTSAAVKNAKTLQAYLQPYQVTRLEWEILQFNLLWAGSFAPPANYLTSYPLIFDYRNNRFRIFFSINENREFRDPDPWSSLSRLNKESIMRGAVDQAKALLRQSISEINTRPELLFVEFRFRVNGGSFVNAATYENGELKLVE